MPTKNIIRVAIIVLVILLIPVLGNLFVDGWNWGPLDFVIIGLLLFFTGCAIDYAARNITDPIYRIIAIAAIVGVLLLIWVELAVDAVSSTLKLLF